MPKHPLRDDVFRYCKRSGSFVSPSPSGLSTFTGHTPLFHTLTHGLLQQLQRGVSPKALWRCKLLATNLVVKGADRLFIVAHTTSYFSLVTGLRHQDVNLIEEGHESSTQLSLHLLVDCSVLCPLFVSACRRFSSWGSFRMSSSVLTEFVILSSTSCMTAVGGCSCVLLSREGLGC
jgi:hypothetical protein